MRLIVVLAVLMGLAVPALAQEGYQFPEDPDADAFVRNEVVATFYHELGHALIHVLDLPVLGKEEDAADHLSVILMNDIWEEDAAAAILTSDAAAYAMLAAQREEAGYEPSYADEHSLDMQRYYTVVCLFYGANPEARKPLADALGLPEERAERCQDEWDSTAASWDAMLADATPGDDTTGLVMADGQDELPIAQMLAEEVVSINERFGLPEPVTVEVADCGEANAYYSPDDRTITMCNEYAQNLQDMWEATPD